MKNWLAIAAFSAVLFGPLAASAVGPSQCANLRRQIDHYQRMNDRAVALDSDLWRQRMGSHLGTLKALQVDHCPQDVPRDDTAMRAFMQLLRLAGSAALTYFTFGAM